jgi:amino acid adenylation domain-containing protein
MVRKSIDSAASDFDYEEALNALLQEEGISTAGSEPIPATGRCVAPLSFAQRPVWFYERWQPGTPTYNVAVGFWVDGPVDVDTLERAFTALVNRHDSLRTRYEERDGEPVQVVEELAVVPFVRRTVDAPGDRRTAAALEQAQAEVRVPFALDRSGPVRVLLLELAPDRHLLVLTMHHIAVDGWSFELLLPELDALYRELAAGGAPSGRDRPIRYVDYAEWERGRWDGGALAEQVAYWRSQLAGAPDLLAVPTDRPRPQLQTFNGRTVGFEVPDGLAAGVRQLGAQAGVTPFTVYLAAFNVLLARYCGDEDVVVGTPVAVRGRTELDTLVGNLVNTVALRTDLSGNPSFGELLRRVLDVTGAAQSHQEVPFERLVTELRPERVLSHSPIVQVIFGLQDEPPGERRLGPARLTPVHLERGTAKFDMTWSVFTGQRTRLEVEYNCDLFEAASVARLIDHYLRLLESALADPRQRIGDLTMLAEEELQQILRQSRGGGPTPEELRCIHDMVAYRARTMPGAVCVTHDGAQLRFAELDERANRLANHLRTRGVRTESVVGVCLERGVDMVVVLLAVLKAGGAYLPIDPSYPRDRVAFMLTDAEAELVICSTATRQQLADHRAELLDLDEEGRAIAAAPATDPAAAVTPDCLAYIIYTSGSTGRPKGVHVTHRNVLRLMTSTHTWFGFNHRDVWTMFHSYAFDFSVWEIWGALGFGGRLVVVPHLVSRSPSDFLELLRAERVTVLNQTPSAFRQLVAADAESGGELALRLVIFGGEAVDLTSVARWWERHPQDAPRLVNMYGITETTVHVTYRPLTLADTARQANPIGVPIPDLQVYVLDRWGNPVPTGVPGELYIGGAGVARGYGHRPVTTAERFVPDPFGPRGARLYRSGDVGRRAAGGDLEYLGRNDDQVKVRGYRIETGEIEAAIARHPQVRGAVVVVHRDGRAAARLVGYVAAERASLTTAALREHLGRTLPQYMLPAVFVFLDELPVTANGKVDRQALPAPETERPELAEEYAPPRTDAERVLAEIWGEVLDLERVGVRDNFFDLGGDSIRSLQVLGRAKQRGLEFTLQDLFRAPLIEDLAAVLRRVERPEAPRVREPFALVPAKDREKLPDGLEDAYPMSVLQAGMVFHMGLDTENLPYHNVNSFHLRAPFDAELFARAAQDVADRHAILRTSFELSRYSEPMQLVHREARLPVEVGDLRDLPVEEQERQLLELLRTERRRPFSLDRPPFLRYLLHRRTNDTFQWTVTEHHAIFDGWSLFSTQAEVLGRYLRLLREPDAPADPPPSSAFRDFIELERAAIAADTDRRYWQEKLRGLEPATLPRWPTVARQPAGADAYDTAVSGEVDAGVRHWRFTSTENATHRALETLVPIDICDRLIAFAAEAGVPFKSVLLAAHLKVIGLVTGRADVVTGLTANGRLEEVDGTEVRGMFLNVPPIRVDLSAGTWSELARRTFRAEEELLPHRRYPLAQMQWDAGGAGLFDNTFLYNHFHVMQDVLGDGVEVLDDKIESTTEYRAEPTSFSLSTGFLRNPRSSQLLLRLDYYTEKLSDEQAEAMRGYYLAVLAAMARGDGRHETFSPLSRTERRQLVEDWNGEPRSYPVGRCIHELVAVQAHQVPDAVAVVGPDRELTYRELDREANRLARHLRELGAGPETVVGVCVPRDAEMLVTLLGVLKSGAAYLPLDPGYPTERLHFMLADAGAKLVVTRAALLDRVPAGATSVVTDRDAAAIARQDGSDLGRTSHPDNLAYVMYTSGSTGTPKGVQVHHRGVVNYLGWAREGYACRGTGGGAPVFSSFAFDMIVPNMYTPLIMGERVCVVPESLDLTELGRYLERHGPFNFIKLTPGHLNLLGQALGPAAARRLAGTLAVGADAFPSRNLAAWRRIDPDTVVLNEYGPTEASVGNTIYHTDGPVAQELVPIGRPIPNTTMYVLDADLNLAPIGSPGELYIGGDCVVRGYAGRPGLTAERFVPDPFSAHPGARMYRTGDLGRWLPDGQLDFLGRVDDQVKVNGYRVELGEIESVLNEHPAVAEAVATVVGRGTPQARLAGYYVPARPDVDGAELMAFLRDRLPAYLLPSALLEIAEVPLNANGKVDRKALPDPGRRLDGDRRRRVAPRVPLEELLAVAWGDLLGTAEVALEDNFFALGGNSLNATQLAFRLQEALAVEVPLSAVLAARTLAELSDALGELVRARHGDEVADALLEPVGSTVDGAASHG